MKRIFVLIACAGTLLLSACGGESKLPNPTGKGTIRAINAISGSPDMVFLIEETQLGDVAYKESSSPTRFDDFEYSFNFDVQYPGNVDLTRVATQSLKVEKDRDHIFLLTGESTAPTVSVLTGDERRFEAEDTVFEARFVHASESLGDIDVYFDVAGTVLGTNAPVATLSFGEIFAPVDLEEGIYVMTVTAAGDLNTVHFLSYETPPLLPQFAHVITIFDGDGNNPAPITADSITSGGGTLTFIDSRYPPETRFIHGAYTLEAIDVYDDELLTSLFAEDLAFQEATSDIEASEDDGTYYFTPAGSQATILFDMVVAGQAPGTINHIFLHGGTDAWRGKRVTPDRSSSAISAKLRLFGASPTFPIVDVYLKDAGEPIEEDDMPLFFSSYPFYSPTIQLEAGMYDIYLTEQNTKNEISAVYQVDLSLGEIVELMIVDTVDPAIVELIDIPVP